MVNQRPELIEGVTRKIDADSVMLGAIRRSRSREFSTASAVFISGRVCANGAGITSGRRTSRCHWR